MRRREVKLFGTVQRAAMPSDFSASRGSQIGAIVAREHGFRFAALLCNG
jgi:hypothetical protein